MPHAIENRIPFINVSLTALLIPLFALRIFFAEAHPAAPAKCWPNSATSRSTSPPQWHTPSAHYLTLTELNRRTAHGLEAWPG